MILPLFIFWSHSYECLLDIPGHYRLHTSTYAMQKKKKKNLFFLPLSSLFLHSSIEHHRRRHGCCPLSLQLWEKKRAKYPSFHISCLTFIQAVTKIKTLNTNLLFKKKIYYHLVVLQVVTFLPVRMGEYLSTHPESKGAGCSSIMSV